MTCRRSIKSGQRADTLQWIVRSYPSDYAERAERELRFYQIQRTLKDAVGLAALAKLPSGKRHSHQRRIPTRTLELAKERLFHVDLGGCKTFEVWGVSRRTAYRLAEAGLVRVARFGRRVTVPAERSSVCAWKASTRLRRRTWRRRGQGARVQQGRDN